MAETCCDVIGGEWTLRVDGKLYHGMGDLTILPASVERTGEATANGEMVITEKSKLVRARLGMANRCDAPPKDLMLKRCHGDVTFIEKSRQNRRHIFARAAVVGDPEFNLATGMVTGFEFVCAPKDYLEVL